MHIRDVKMNSSTGIGANLIVLELKNSHVDGVIFELHSKQ